MKLAVTVLAVILAGGTSGDAIAADRKCPKRPGKIKLDGVLHVSKKMNCIGAALMADDLERELDDAYPEFPSKVTVWAHGTGTADTPKQSRYRCIVKSDVANESLQLDVVSTCRNGRGDRWTYRMLF